MKKEEAIKFIIEKIDRHKQYGEFDHVAGELEKIRDILDGKVVVIKVEYEIKNGMEWVYTLTSDGKVDRTCYGFMD